MPFTITQPYGLLALAIVPLVLWFSRQSLVPFPAWRKLAALGVRIVLVLLVALALADIRYHGKTTRTWRIFAIDASRSIGGDSVNGAASYYTPPAPLRSDVTEMFCFAGQPRSVVEIAADGRPTMMMHDDWSPGESDATNLALAIAAARAAIPADYVPQVVLMTDGNQTAGDAVAAAKSAGVPIDVVPLAPVKKEVYVSELRAPAAVRPGVDFSIEAVVYAMGNADGSAELLLKDKVIAAEKSSLKPGENTVRFTHSLREPGEASYTVRLTGFADTIAENNQAGIRIVASGRPRVLIVEGQPGAGKHLAAALEKNLLDTTTRAAGNLPADETLASYELLVLVNTPAAAISGRVKAIEQYVRGGGGLLLIGGDQAFTPGGYKGTVLEAMLPLASHVKDKPREPLSLVLVIDTSMSMEGPGIELAKQATRKAVEMLSASDTIGVLSFADESRWITPLSPCSDKKPILKSIENIQAGGRTNMAPALERAFLALEESWADRRHIILLTDGLSDPGDFDGLGTRIAKAGVTISTVALGDEAAQELLKDIAQKAKGRFYYCRDASSVPSVFAMETSSAGNIGITEEAVQPKLFSKEGKASRFGFADLPTLTGYDEAKAKPASEVWIETAAGDALLASMPLGQGRSTAFVSDVQNRWAAAWLKWPEFDRFWTQVARSAMRSDDANSKFVTRTANYPEELRVRPLNTGLLETIAKESGGRFDPKPEEIWAPSGEMAMYTIQLWHWLLISAVMVFLADVFVKRAR